MKDPVHKFVQELWDKRNPIRRHILKILGAKPNRLEILQEISYGLLKNYTRTRRIIEEGPEHIELWVYKMANDSRKWKLQIDKNPLWAQSLDKEIPESMDLYQFHEEPDLWVDCLTTFQDIGVSERDREIFFKFWREEHSEIFIAFKMELPLSTVISSLKLTLKVLRREWNPNRAKRIKPQPKGINAGKKHTEEQKARFRESYAQIPKLTCPRCKRSMIEGKYREYGHGLTCTQIPLKEPSRKNPNLSAALKGVPKPKVQCPNCGTWASAPSLARWHGKSGENCENLKINQIRRINTNI